MHLEQFSVSSADPLVIILSHNTHFYIINTNTVNVMITGVCSDEEVSAGQH